MHEATAAKRMFIALWAVVLLLKCAIAVQLPLFVDEAFYWQEGQHPAWAYSDLPGLTAWLTRLGVEIGGQHPLALRLPFLLIAALVPWCLVGIAQRESASHPWRHASIQPSSDQRFAWQVGSLSLMLPLLGTLGLLALPDVPMALATVLCLDGGMRLLRGVNWSAVSLLAAGLVIGALSHYRFVAVIGVGFIALLVLPEGRRALCDWRVWTAVVLGALAWLPLLLWNLHNADAGLRFQLIDRHPWTFDVGGLSFIAIQSVLATPLLLFAMVCVAWLRSRNNSAAASRYLAWSGGMVLLGFFVLGFFADTERVSFHWPLPAYLALLPLVPAWIAAWPRGVRIATWGLAMIGLVAVLGYYTAVSSPMLRERNATSKWYPLNFSGWDVLAREVAAQRARMPANTRIVADSFKTGSELGFALNDPQLPVLDHPLNHQHGRAPQLRLWGLQRDWHLDAQNKMRDAPVLLVVGTIDVSYKNLLRRYHDLCAMVGPLPSPKVLNIDHGRQRFLLFSLKSQALDGNVIDDDVLNVKSLDQIALNTNTLDSTTRKNVCTTPAMAWIDTPAADAQVTSRFELNGWAFKDGVGIANVEVLINGSSIATADYGIQRNEVIGFWRKWNPVGSTDPQQPHVGFRADIQLGNRPPGRYWLGLRLHGRDGSVEDSPEQPVQLK